MLVQPTAIDIHVKHFQAISFRWKHLRPGLDSGCSHQCNCLKAAAGHISLCERYFPLRLETVVGLWLIHWLAGWTLSIVLVIYIRVDCSGFVSFCIVLCLFPLLKSLWMKPPWQFVSLCELCGSELTRDLRTGVAHQKADANAMQRCIGCSIDICNSCQYNAIYVRTIHTYFHIYHILSDIYIHVLMYICTYSDMFSFRMLLCSCTCSRMNHHGAHKVTDRAVCGPWQRVWQKN